MSSAMCFVHTFLFLGEKQVLGMEDGEPLFLWTDVFRFFFFSSCLLEAFTLATIDGYSKHYEKYQFTLIMDLPVVLEVKCIQGVMQAHRPLKSPIKN